MSVTSTATSPTPSAANTANFYALKFTGYIDVTTGGVYTFLLTADDAAKLWIGDAVVDNDGHHTSTTVSGQVALAAGKQPFTLGYMQRTSTSVLDLSWIGPGIAQQTIPASAYYH